MTTRTVLLDPRPDASGHLTYPPARHRKRGRLLLAGVLVTALAIGAAAYAHGSSARPRLDAHGWPAAGSAALRISGGPVQTSPRQPVVPIASLAKVMTALVVLRAHPLRDGVAGPALVVTAGDVRDTVRRRADQESIVPVVAGEVLSESRALEALLLPSANNVAVMLARWTDGSVRGFVAAMNRSARALGMRDTVYTDPSGLDAATVSTARDQVLLATAAMRNPTFASLVVETDARLPVAGVVHNTDHLIGRYGFDGIKTGSDDAAGGCFMFRTWRVVRGVVRAVLGVVLGQPGDNLIDAGQVAARLLADNVSRQLVGA